ncbi:MAG: N-acetylneuraminate synthase family protein, partial [Dehalococcoidia bacterium]|nr:N-acetylneuraminate synthase family protein [Dehalococcoidia bacterium]
GEGTEEIVLLHCVSSYPAKIEDMNLRAMATLEETFKLPVGLSDHTLGITIPIAAAALGACVIEKHFTMDKSLNGPDHKASLEPGELKEMVIAIRDVAKALGDGVKRPTKEEEETKKVARRSVVAKVDIAKGAVITGEMLAIRRPGTGIEPGNLSMITGKRAKRKIKSDELIAFSEVQ